MALLHAVTGATPSHPPARRRRGREPTQPLGLSSGRLQVSPFPSTPLLPTPPPEDIVPASHWSPPMHPGHLQFSTKVWSCPFLPGHPRWLPAALKMKTRPLSRALETPPENPISHFSLDHCPPLTQSFGTPTFSLHQALSPLSLCICCSLSLKRPSCLNPYRADSVTGAVHTPKRKSSP